MDNINDYYQKYSSQFNNTNNLYPMLSIHFQLFLKIVFIDISFNFINIRRNIMTFCCMYLKKKIYS